MASLRHKGSHARAGCYWRFSPIPSVTASAGCFARPCKRWPSGCASSTNGSAPTMTESSECLSRTSAVKNDANDAEAICEAVTRPSMRFVPIKSAAQHEVQALHRVREQLLKSRTALVNQARGLLAEHGIVAPQGIARAR